MNRITIMILFVLASLNVFSQRNVVPKNITEAIKILNKESDKKTKIAVKNRADEDLRIPFILGNHDYFLKWTDPTNKNSPIKKYLEEKGILTVVNQQIVILTVFKNSLLGLNIPESDVLSFYQKKELKIQYENKVRFITDSLQGVYIPKDLEDCFKQIDSFWSDSVKTEIKSMTEEQFSTSSHFGIGLWMRNNWQLWAGSRLSKFFNDAGIQHPDDMSGIILDSYYRHLTGKEIRFNEQIKSCQDYWDKSGTSPTRK